MDAPISDSNNTSAHLTDVVLLTTARTPAEASMIVALLDDEEIPAIVTGMNTSSTYSGIAMFEARICVPRSLETKALETLRQIRSDAERHGLDEAFDPNLQEQEYKENAADPAFIAAASLAGMPMEDRISRLKILLAEWLEQSDSNVHIAERLAAAGLSRKQADDLMKSINPDDAVMQSARNKRTLSGIVIIVAGIAVGLARPSITAPQLILLGLVLVIAGIGIIVSATAMKPRNWKAKE